MKVYQDNLWTITERHQEEKRRKLGKNPITPIKEYMFGDFTRKKLCGWKLCQSLLRFRGIF